MLQRELPRAAGQDHGGGGQLPAMRRARQDPVFSMVSQRVQLYSYVNAEAMSLSNAYGWSHARCPRKDRMYYTNWVYGAVHLAL